MLELMLMFAQVNSKLAARETNPYQSGAQIVGCPDCVYVLLHNDAMGGKPNLGIPIWAQIGRYVEQKRPRLYVYLQSGSRLEFPD